MFFYQNGVGKPCSATYFFEVGTRVLLKLAAKGFLRRKKISFQVVFLKEKRRYVTKKFEMFLIDLALSLSATYFLEVGARVSLKIATKEFLRVKKTLKI